MKPTWPQVAVVGLIVAGVVTTAALGRDTTALIGLGTLLLAGIGLIAGTQLAIKDQTNGNTTRLLGMVEKMAAQLAQMAPPPAGDQPAEQPPDEQPPTGS